MARRDVIWYDQMNSEVKCNEPTNFQVGNPIFLFMIIIIIGIYFLQILILLTISVYP